MPLLISFIFSTIPLAFKEFRALLFPERPLNPPYAQCRLIHIEYIRGIAILGVIAIHIQLLFQNAPQILGTTTTFFRFAVPVFLIFSGALVHLPDNSYWSFFRPKLLRTGLPYLLANLVAILYFGLSLSDLPATLVTGEAAPQFYFIPILFQCYLLAPFLLKLQGSRLFLPGVFLLSWFWQYFVRMPYVSGIPLCIPQLFFFAFGMAHADRIRANKPILSKEAQLLFLTAFTTSIFLVPGRYGNEQYLYALCILDALMGRTPLGYLERFFSFLGRNSLWIYLLHWWVMAALF